MLKDWLVRMTAERHGQPNLHKEEQGKSRCVEWYEAA